MKLVTIVYVTDMDRSLAWYRALLPGAELVSSSPFWSELSLGLAGSLALHATEATAQGSQLGLALTADRPLEAIRDAVRERDVLVVRDIQDEPFGRSFVIADPDGLPIQINEHDPQRYPTSD